MDQNCLKDTAQQRDLRTAQNSQNCTTNDQKDLLLDPGRHREAFLSGLPQVFNVISVLFPTLERFSFPRKSRKHPERHQKDLRETSVRTSMVGNYLFTL